MTILKAKDLIGKRKIVVRPKSMKFKIGTYDYEFPDDTLIIESAYQYSGNGNDQVQIAFRTLSRIIKSSMKQSLNVPSLTEFIKVEGMLETKILNRYDKFVLENLESNIHHYFSVGSDPEVFVEDENGNVIPAFKYLPDKKKPLIGANGNNTVYWDGFQAEFTTMAATCLDSHTASVAFGLKEVLNAALKVNPKAKLSTKTIVEIPMEVLQTADEKHVEFGCMPSLNVYGLKGGSYPAREVTFRPAGGHIHLGIGQKSDEMIQQIVKSLDAILGVACVSLFAKYDDPKRRALYGLPGEYRLPKHGLEYRTLSNAWLIHPMIKYIVFGLARNAVMFGELGLLKHWKATEQETIDTIMKCDVKKAQKILKKNKTILLKMFKGSYAGFSDKKCTKLFNILLQGIDSVVLDPKDFLTNWTIDPKKSFNYSTKQVRTNIGAILEGKKVA